MKALLCWGYTHRLNIKWINTKSERTIILIIVGCGSWNGLLMKVDILVLFHSSLHVKLFSRIEMCVRWCLFANVCLTVWERETDVVNTSNFGANHNFTSNILPDILASVFFLLGNTYLSNIQAFCIVLYGSIDGKTGATQSLTYLWLLLCYAQQSKMLHKNTHIPKSGKSKRT